MTDVLLPDIGDFHDVEVIEILVEPGDRVDVEDPLITLESDKASMEIPAPQAGVVEAVKVVVGDKLNRGDLILILAADPGEGAAQDAGAQGDAPAEAAEMVEDTTAAAPIPTPAAMPAAASAAASAVPDEAPVAAAAMVAGELREVPLPDIGDFRNVEIIEVLVAVGDMVEVDQSLLTLESDKATMEIPAPFAGTVRAITVGVGDKISQGDPIVTLETRAAAPAMPAEPAATPPAPSPEAHAPHAEAAARLPGDKEQLRRPVLARPDDAPRGRAHASPGVRRFARELGVDLYQVPGSGPKGRITKTDVQDYVKRALAEGAPSAAASAAPGSLALPEMPVVDFARFGDIEEVELGRIKKLSGAHLHRSWLHVPHVTQFDEADITELEAFRQASRDDAARAEVKLTFMPFLMKAVCKALADYPQFNSSLSPDGARLIMKKYMHIGVAVDTPNGLVVPVVRDVDRKGVYQLAGELGELSAKARAGKLAPGDLQGGCISISSLGGIGGTQFTPIVNAPEVAILGVSRAETRPVWNGSTFEPRLIMPFSLSYDHRVIDGAEGVRFTTTLRNLLGDIRRLLL